MQSSTHLKNKSITPLEAGQVYLEDTGAGQQPNRIEVKFIGTDYVCYTSTVGRFMRYRSPRNRFEGLIRSGVFVLLAKAGEEETVEALTAEIRSLRLENCQLKSQLVRIKKQLLYLGEKP